jgi:acetyl-CoA C-acetyltransferase
MSATIRPAAVLGGNRLPFARANREYDDASNQDMLTAALDGLTQRFGLQGERVGEVVGGAVLKHARDFNLVRESVLGSQLSSATPAHDLQKACDTGLEAVISVANKIALGQVNSGVAGGADTVSDAPVALNDDLRQVLLEFNAARSAAERAKVLGKLRPKHVIPDIPRNEEPRTGLSMGEHAAETAERWGISRREQDELAVASHRNLAAAYERGLYDELVSPYLGLQRDGNLRPEASLDSLAKLTPVFGEGEAATMTPGNSTPLTDGASTVLLASEDWAHQHGLPVQAYLTYAKPAAVDYIHGDEGLLMAPVHAVPAMLDDAGLALGDFDLYEIHEAFASTVLATLAAWEDPAYCKERLDRDEPLGSIDRDKLNVAGGSVAAGHPFAATGGRIVATAAKLLDERGGGRCLISICAAGGNGLVAILER